MPDATNPLSVMKHLLLTPRRLPKFVIGLAVLIVTTPLLISASAEAEELVTLRSGLTLQGSSTDIPSLNQNAFESNGGIPAIRPILLVDDGLRRVYVHRRGMVVGAPQQIGGILQTIDFDQPIPTAGKKVQSMGDIISASPFNEYGWRTIVVRGPNGLPLSIVQGISSINERYAKIEALKAKPSLTWDMRVSTKSILPQTLQKIFRKKLDQNDPDSRLEAVRFFMASQRYRAAEEELTRVIRQFPELKDMQANLAGIIEQQALRLVDEAQRRMEVGQTNFARSILERFPMSAVGKVRRQSVRDMIDELNQTDQQVKALVESLQADVARLPAPQQAALKAIVTEIVAGLSPNTLARLSDYTRLKDADNVSLENRVALAVAGWLMGAGSGEQNLVIATSLVKVRDLVHEYLGTDDANRRKAILQELDGLEGSQASYVARLLPQLLPTLPFPEGSEDPDVEGFYRIGQESARGSITFETSIGGEGVDYVIQLPPEYDPLREYPCILALPPPGLPAEAELTWWAGEVAAGKTQRGGHAMRNGYIVVSPVWSRGTQRKYEYTRREHRAVLAALRDAMRRASIDSDRVFLTGHGEGATAAWDIALAHPDHWAGMISINGEPSKTIRHYFPNARHVPMYFLMGGSSGPTPPLIRMGAILDDYMNVNNDATVVMYRGRGSEDFFEEIPELFRWMNATTHVRQSIPDEIDVVTMRTGDQYFWWLELGPLKPSIDIEPVLWNADRITTGNIEAAIRGDNLVRVASIPSDSFRLLFRPGMGLDLNKPIDIRHGSVTSKLEFDQSIEPLLEDTRTRADRKRPYWFSFSYPPPK